MNTDFQMEYKESLTGLHVRVRGVFDGRAAASLVDLLRHRGDGVGRIFIDTRELEPVRAPDCREFQRCLAREALPAQKLFFKGEQGFKLGPNGCRVLLLKKEPCKGACRNCACAKRMKGRAVNMTDTKQVVCAEPEIAQACSDGVHVPFFRRHRWSMFGLFYNIFWVL